MQWPFETGRAYSRLHDIRLVYGGQRQGGISTPVGTPAVFIFTGETGAQHGYEDKFLPDGSFCYTGQGQIGDMQMGAGNRAIRDHAIAGKDLLVFRSTGKSRPYIFIDAFSCAGWEYSSQPDTKGAMRQAIVFTLVPINSINAKDDVANVKGEDVAADDLLTLRARALAAAAPAPATATQKTRTVYERSADVRRYVLARADGKCEGCGTPAPFITAAGEPYLEAHHIRRLTDGGPDDPSFVAGICPNCHRRAHYGSDRATLNEELLAAVQAAEASFA